MLRSVNNLHDYTIHAQDGEIGSVDDILFDELSWAVRYCVVNAGSWLTGRRVLIIPAALDVPDRETGALVVDLTRQQVVDSPPVELDVPVSRQKEYELHRYFDWTPYWTTGLHYGVGASAASEAAAPEVWAAAQAQNAEDNESHLRSTEEVIGYHIQASDGEVGHVEDFLVDDETWIIQYMIVDTRNWLPGKRVLIAPTWITDIVWTNRKVHVDLKRDTIKDSPEYDPSMPVSREYEDRLHDYYGRPKYWINI